MKLRTLSPFNAAALMHVGGETLQDLSRESQGQTGGSPLIRSHRQPVRHHAPTTLLMGLVVLAATAPSPSASSLLRSRHATAPLLQTATSGRVSQSSLLRTRVHATDLRGGSTAGSKIMPTVIKGESLVPNFDESKWGWVTGAATVPGLGGAPGAAPGPAPAAAPGAAPAPGQAGGPCDELKKKGEADFPGQFLDCKEFRYYGATVFAQSAPYGCHCSSWSVNCPYETCRVTQAWEDKCLDKGVMDMGFTALSKMSNYLPPSSIPKLLRPHGSHPDYISMCMYWRAKPPNHALPPVDTSKFVGVFPDFATLRFEGIGLAGCMKFLTNEMSLAQAKTGLLTALGAMDLEVVSITCGDDLTNEGSDMLITGPPDLVKQAASKQQAPDFCFDAVGVKVCTGAMPPAPAPAPGPAPGR